MKRPSEIVYSSLDERKTEFELIPKFNFTEDTCLPRLVEYSFTDVSDSDDDADGPSTSHVDPLHKLHSDLIYLKSKMTKVQCYRRSQGLNARHYRHVRIKTSRTLKAEEDKEKLRNEYVLHRVNKVVSETVDSTSIRAVHAREQKVKSSQSICQVYDNERPCKKRKLDFTMLKRFKRKAFSKKSKQTKLLFTDRDDFALSGCLVGLLKTKRGDETLQ